MSREAILKIKETEEEAERILSEARARAQELVADAEDEGRRLCQVTEAETAAQLADMLSQIRERTVTMNERVASETEQEVEALRKEVSLRRKSAEKIIIRGFESKWR